ncbi:MAG: HAD hydrolase-like protein [Ktedonobacterales bacterium]
MSAHHPACHPRPALFLLRDGVLCDRVACPPARWDDSTFLAGALDGLRLLSHLALPVIILAGTTGAPPDVATRRRSTESHSQMRAALRSRCLRVDAVRGYPLPSVEDRLHRRSALPRVLQRAARLYDVDLASSLLICDAWADAAAALATGCQPILVMTGAGREQIALPCPSALRNRTWYAADLAMAAQTAGAARAAHSAAETVA